MRAKAVSLDKLIFWGLIFFSIIPDVGVKFSFAGFTWTAYRIIVVLSIITIVALQVVLKFDVSHTAPKWLLFMTFWVVYGFALLFVGKYSDIHNGFVEMLSIFNGLIVMYVIRLFLQFEENRYQAIKLLYWLLNLMIIFGFAEIITGKHLATSAFLDPASSIYSYSNAHLATGLMYNVNDYSALITCMSPILIDRRLGKKRIVTLICILVINQINDANTCTLAILFFVLYFLLIIVGGKTRKAFLCRLLFWAIVVGSLAFIFFMGAGLTERTDVIGAIARHIFNAKRSTGSLYFRLTIYKDALLAWLSTGMIGLGPSGFSSYFSANTSASGLINPHSLVLEILSQYGIIIGTWFIFLLYKMFIAGKKLCNEEDSNSRTRGIMVIAFVIVYVIASFAPSTFIGYPYQWLLIAVMCSFLDNSEEIGGLVYA